MFFGVTPGFAAGIFDWLREGPGLEPDLIAGFSAAYGVAPLQNIDAQRAFFSSR